jgi:hypothetical protein
MKSDYSFKTVTFTGARVITHDPVAASVRPTTPNRVAIRIDAATIKRCAFKAGDMLTPFIDLENRAVLLLSGQRPIPESARKLWGKGKNSGTLEIEFPRTDGFEELFPVALMRGMVLREASHGRLVFTVPKVK